MTNIIPNNIQQELNTLSNNLNGIKSSMIDMGITISSSDDLSTYGSKISSKNSELVNANTTLQQEKEQLQSDNNTLTQTNATLTSQNQSLTTANNTLTTQNNELTQANETLTSQNEELTTNNNILTSQNNELTLMNETLTNNNTQINGYLSDIKTALIAQGIVTSSDDYSIYADKIGEMEMGGSYEKVLINNGTNGWYLIDRKTNWVKMCYIYTFNSSHFASYDNNYVYGPFKNHGQYEKHYWISVQLPFTFSYVMPSLNPQTLSIGGTITNNISATANINGTLNVTHEADAWQLGVTYRIPTVNKELDSFLTTLSFWVCSDKMNKICIISGSGNSQYKSALNGANLYIWAEGMIEG